MRLDGVLGQVQLGRDLRIRVALGNQHEHLPLPSRHLPRRYRGILVGIATGVKLTPGIFIVFLLVTRRFREAAMACAATVGTIAIGWLVMPGSATAFWTRYIFDPGRPGPAHYISNQSLRGAIVRITETPRSPLWLLTAMIVGAAGLLTAKQLHERGLRLDAVVVTAFTGLLVSPISWSNHWVWALPAAVVLWSHRRTFAAVWVAVFAAGLPWWMPFSDDREFDLTFLQSLAGNAYAICAVLLLTRTAGRSWNRTTLRGPKGTLGVRRTFGGGGAEGGSDASGSVGSARLA